MKDLAALIIGGGSGLGLMAARLMVRDGSTKIGLIDVSTERAELSSLGATVKTAIGDISTRDGAQAAFGSPNGGFRSTATGAIMPLEFIDKGKLRTVSLAAPVTVSSADTLAHCARLGLGIIQKPRYSATADIEAGRLVELLAQTPPASSPVPVLYPRDRHLSPLVRAFIDWAAKAFGGP